LELGAWGRTPKWNSLSCLARSAPLAMTMRFSLEARKPLRAYRLFRGFLVQSRRGESNP
jgi:hypothetical protein